LDREKHAASNYKSRLGDENGSRIYQKKMELLPSNLPAKNFIKYSPNLSKGKKHALTYNDDDDASPSSPKKPWCDVPEVSDDIRMGDVGDAGEEW